jgi:hypothetical protein
MPSEVSIAKHLSGPEVLESILHSFRAAMNKDDRFMSHVAYSGYHAEVDFHFYPAMSFVPPLERNIRTEDGDLSNLQTVPETVKLEIPLRPPNEVREDADMPLPVLVTHSDGRQEEKWVKKGKAPKQNKAPKNADSIQVEGDTILA